MSHRKALLIHNGNAGNKHIEKALGAVVPVLSQALDEVIVRQTKKKTMRIIFANPLMILSTPSLFSAATVQSINALMASAL